MSKPTVNVRFIGHISRDKGTLASALVYVLEKLTTYILTTPEGEYLTAVRGKSLLTDQEVREQAIFDERARGVEDRVWEQKIRRAVVVKQG